MASSAPHHREIMPEPKIISLAMAACAHVLASSTKFSFSFSSLVFGSAPESFFGILPKLIGFCHDKTLCSDALSAPSRPQACLVRIANSVSNGTLRYLCGRYKKHSVNGKRWILK